MGIANGLADTISKGRVNAKVNFKFNVSTYIKARDNGAANGIVKAN